MAPIVVFNESRLEVELEGELAAMAVAASSKMMDQAELSHLVACLQAAELTDDDLVVEIGAFVGATTVLMHRALSQMGNHLTPIVSIDPFPRSPIDRLNPNGSYRRYRRRVLAAGAGKRCLALTGFSQYAYRALPDRIGLLVVDGDHRFDAVWGDLTLYADKVRRGGIMFVDDYGPETYPGVVRAVDEFLVARPDFSLMHRSWYAILRRE